MTIEVSVLTKFIDEMSLKVSGDGFEVLKRLTELINSEVTAFDQEMTHRYKDDI